MGIISFASMKGGVGKTSAAVNVSHALASRGCETLLIDLDPTCHASRYYRPAAYDSGEAEAPLTKLFVLPEIRKSAEELGSLIDAASEHNLELIYKVRSCLNILPAASPLRCFLMEEAKEIFSNSFSELIEELEGAFDYIVIDTPPDFNTLTQAAISASDLVVVPVDSSALSINGMEEMLSRASDIEGPHWSIVRMMVTRNASRIQRLSNARLDQQVVGSRSEDDSDFEGVASGENVVAIDFEAGRSGDKTGASQPAAANDKPIFLLDSVIYRTEEQNRLSYRGKTAFDVRSASRLAGEYSALAKELESALVTCEELKSCKFADDFMDFMSERM